RDALRRGDRRRPVPLPPRRRPAGRHLQRLLPGRGRRRRQPGDGDQAQRRRRRSAGDRQAAARAPPGARPRPWRRQGVRRGHRGRAVHARRLPLRRGGAGAAAGAGRRGRPRRARRGRARRPRLRGAAAAPGRVDSRPAGATGRAGAQVRPELGRKLLAAALTPHVLAAALAFASALVVFLSTRPPELPPPPTVEVTGGADGTVPADVRLLLVDETGLEWQRAGRVQSPPGASARLTAVLAALREALLEEGV